MKIPALITVIATALTVILTSYTQKEPVDKATLGELLFSDPILSGNKKISCASCHRPEYAFADTSAVSRGVGGKKGTRNTPTAMNVRLQQFFFWDGRAKNLEEQALAPIQNPVEMNLPIEKAVARLQKSKKYNAYFKKIFKQAPDQHNLAAALAAFERTLETSDSPFDNWKFYDDSTAVNDAVKRGFALFNGKGKCIQCHFGADFTANEFRNIGMFNGSKAFSDSGRSVVTHTKQDEGKFKTPSLRNAAVTAPYFHNGFAKTLMDVINFYDSTEKFVQRPINKDSILLKPLGLTAEEKKDLESFLISLTDKRFSKLITTKK